MYTMWYGFHPSTTKIYCVRCWHSQKQWSLSKQPLKWTKKKKKKNPDMLLGSVDRQLTKPRLGKS